MLLYSRQLTLTGSPRKTMPWAMEITSYVNAHSPLDVSLWATNFGAPVGTMAWTTIVESQAQLATGAAGLLADDGYLDRIDAAAEFVTAPAEDRISEVIHGTIGERAAVGAIAQITTATAIVDEMAGALRFAVEIAQHIEGVIGSPILVMTSLFGDMGGVTWVGVQPDIEASDMARAKLQTDSSYFDRVAKSKDLFIPGSGHTSQVVRVA